MLFFNSYKFKIFKRANVRLFHKKTKNKPYKLVWLFFRPPVGKILKWFKREENEK